MNRKSTNQTKIHDFFHPSNSEKPIEQCAQNVIDIGIDAYTLYHQKKTLEQGLSENISITMQKFHHIETRLKSALQRFYNVFAEFHQQYALQFDGEMECAKFALKLISTEYNNIPSAWHFEQTLRRYFEKNFSIFSTNINQNLNALSL